MSLRIRTYRAGDESGIVGLFNEVFSKSTGQTKDIETWRHDYVDNPAGPSYIRVAVDERDRIVGHYAVSPRILNIQAEPVCSVLSMDTVIHPDYQGQRLYVALAEETYHEAKTRGVCLAYGFPNENFKRGLFQNLKFTALPPKPYHMHPLRFRRPLGPMAGALGDRLCRPVFSRLIEKHRAFPNIVENDFEADFSHDENRIHCRRSAEFLSWRYADVGARQYIRLAYVDSGKVLGLAVGRVYDYGNLRGGAVIDLIPQGLDPKVARALFAALAARFDARGCDVIFGVFPESIRRSLGPFRLFPVPARWAPKINWYGVRVFDPEKADPDIVQNGDNWAISLADWDIL